MDGFLISPGYEYSAVQDKEMFLTREMIREKFRSVEAMFKKYRFTTSPIYLEFLMGKREMQCTAWASPTRNILGWKGPCYLITDIHHKTYGDLIHKTPWEKYGYGQRSAVRELPVARGVRDGRGGGRELEAGRHVQDDQVAVSLIAGRPRQIQVRR